jgi:hypothetical protein
MTDETLEFRSALLTPPQVLEYWPKLEPSIVKALAVGVGEMTSFDVCSQAINGFMQIWVTLDSHNDLGCVTVTRTIQHPGSKHLQIVCLTAVNHSVNQMADQFHTLETYAKQNGCQSLQVWGRKGWQRKLRAFRSIKGHPFKTQYYVFDQEL